MNDYATFIGIALAPFAAFALQYAARIGLIAVQKYMPDCWLKKLLITHR